MNRFFNQYEGTFIEDGGAYMSESAKKFARDFKRRLVANLKERDMELVKFTVGHYFISAFIKKNGRFVYLSYNTPRWGEPIRFNKTDALNGFLVRTAENEKDYHGGPNNFTNLIGLIDKAEELLR